jgi:ATP sulfurylase
MLKTTFWLSTVEEIYEWDVTEEAQGVFGTQDLRHPLVTEMHGCCIEHTES